MKFLKQIAKPFIYLYSKLKSLFGGGYKATEYKFKRSPAPLHSTVEINGVRHPKLSREEKRQQVNPIDTYWAVNARKKGPITSDAYTRVKTTIITDREDSAYGHIGAKKK